MQYSSKRVKWMIDTVTDCLGRKKEDVDDYFIQDKNFLQIKDFLDGVAPPKLFFFYQKKQEGFVQEAFKTVNNEDEIILNMGEEDRLCKKACYFFRNKPDGQAVNFEIACDDEVLFGEISPDMIQQLNSLMNNVYDRMICTTGKVTWGQCSDNQVDEFMQQTYKFKMDLDESVKSLSNDLNICVLDKQRFEGMTEQEKQREYQKKFKEWLDIFSERLKDDSGAKGDELDVDRNGNRVKNSTGPGPKTELEYWKKRLNNITALSEQLKSDDFQFVKEFLKKQKPPDVTQRRAPTEENVSNLLAEYQMKEVDLSDKLNQAKDNVKYLGILEKFIEPLYKGTPETIIETLPALMNAIKMIHTIARYYSGTTAMTNLFCKITNQMITNCKDYILRGSLPKKTKTAEDSDEEDESDDDAGSDDKALQMAIWDRDPDELIQVLHNCIKLNQKYQEEYRKIKEKVETLPRGSHFDFSETQIFWKFDIFERRIFKLIEIFKTKQQFNALQKHNLEGIDDLILKFKSKMNDFRSKGHSLLEFEKTKFDKDYVEFNVEISRLDTELQDFIDQNFTKFRNIEYSLKLLTKFQTILKRNSLRHQLQNKYNHILHVYAADLESIQKKFNEHTKQDPPTVRNMPPEAGKIIWARHLFKKITGPIHQFPKTTITKNELQTQLASYNTIGLKLKIYEQWFFRTWCEEIERAKAGLQATLIVRESDTGSLYVNFDIAILQLIREAKCLERQHIQIPETARIILLQEEKFKMYFNELQYVLNEHKKILGKIKPITKDLLQPHLEDLELKLRPGMVTLTWTSMNIDSYLEHVHQGLNKLDQLIISVNDIIENRIENNLKKVSKVLLVDLPNDTQPMSLEQFVQRQEDHIAQHTHFLMSKNEEVERAVDDLVNTVMFYELDPHIIEDKENIHGKEAKKIKRYYFWYLYQALLNATQNSLNAMKYRVVGKSAAGGGDQQNPFFEVDVYLDNQDVKLKPDLGDIQKSINKAATAVLRCSKNLYTWNQKDRVEGKRETLYSMIAKDREIVKVILLLTGSIQGAKNIVNNFLQSFDKFAWLWKEKIKTKLDKFSNKNPSNQDYEDELKKFVDIETQVNGLIKEFKIGAMSLKMIRIQSDLTAWCTQWKNSYSENLHSKAFKSLEHLTETTKQLKQKISWDIKDDIDSLGKVMNTLDIIKKEQSVIQMKFGPMYEQYLILDHYHPNRTVDKEEQDRRHMLQMDWRELIQMAEDKQKDLQDKQANFLQKLIEDVTQFIGDVHSFHDEYTREGPMVPNIDPSEAQNRLKEFTERYEMNKRKFDIYENGESLFGLPHQEYPKLVQIDNELRNLSKLYKLYSEVLDTLNDWRDMLWSEIDVTMISDWMDDIEKFKKQCVALPRDLKAWQAYTELKQQIEDYKEVLPIILELKKPSVQERHWQAIVDITGDDIPYTQEESFMMDHLLKAKILPNKEEIEDVCDSADKQVTIKKRLSELSAYWDYVEFEFQAYKGKDVLCKLGGNQVNEVLEKLEEDQLLLSTIAANRHVGPFREKVTQRQTQFATVDSILNLWMQVQSGWLSLEPVFGSGDIAKKMPLEAKKFQSIDKRWLSIMEKASDTKKVIACCSMDMLKSFLPELEEHLEDCKRSLDEYLEIKRLNFSRFFFVSEQVLLIILSQGSNPRAVVEFFGNKLFDAIYSVEFQNYKSKKGGSKILQIVTVSQDLGGAKETIRLVKPVKCENEIELWLRQLEKSMMKSIRELCRKCNEETRTIKRMRDGSGGGNVDLKDWINVNKSQIALLGIQILWTRGIDEALTKTTGKQEKPNLDPERESADYILKDYLRIMCLEPSGTKLNRIKVETLVTIQVHNLDLFSEALGKVTNVDDFNWQKQCRMYWREDTEHLGIEITNWKINYSYEFLGAKERLCITPLTDRCYITLAQALNMNFGGAPAGPAGTGKTETVKDMGRTLGIFVIVTNCTPEQNFMDMAKIFKGLCQSGLWGCFDEFNRIHLEVLSVVAMQVLKITQAKRLKLRKFQFPGEVNDIGLKPQVGYFITMNPGYAGRQELPENLKVLFRYVAMMVPDRKIIMKVKLASVGFSDFEPLSVKFFSLYGLCEEQLSNQRHYDFGLRNILSVLRTCGATKRENLDGDEEMLCMRTLRDMNLSKLVADDVLLFQSLLADIFPKQKEPQKKVYANMEAGVDKQFTKLMYQNTDKFHLKVVQLYETQVVRHGYMLIGLSGVGKSVIIEILTESFADWDVQTRVIKMNPKAITDTQMYGKKSATDEWTPGVFSKLWEMYIHKNKSSKNWWILCDGPVDTLWIESLNTVLDDNRILTLASGDRLPMSENLKLVFEVENLNNASPATVSRCGIVYVDPLDLGYPCLIQTFIQKRKHNSVKDADVLNTLMNKYLIEGKLIEQIQEFAKKPKMEVNHIGIVTNILRLLNGLLLPKANPQQENIILGDGSDTSAQKEYSKCLIYCIIWSLGGLYEVADREAFNQFLNDKGFPVPQKTSETDTCFDYFLRFTAQNCAEWTRCTPEVWKPPKSFKFSRVILPTMDTMRAEILIDLIAANPKSAFFTQATLLLGQAGTQKTSSIILYAENNKDKTFKRMNFSSATTPFNFYEAISQAAPQKSAGKAYVPENNKEMILFIDDINMPVVNEWGDQVTLEIVRQLIEDGGFYMLERLNIGQQKLIQKLKYLAAMQHPGGGKNDIPNRAKRHFFIFNMVLPASIKEIFGPIIKYHFKEKHYSGEFNRVVDSLCQATIQLWNKVSTTMLRTPAKFHYVFNMRELSRVFKGILNVKKEVAKGALTLQGMKSHIFLIALWKHECERVFVDKLINIKDKNTVCDYIQEISFEAFSQHEGEIMEQLKPEKEIFFCDFLRLEKVNEEGEIEEAAPQIYEAIDSIDKLRKRVNQLMERYNSANPSKKLELVLFDDALKHLLRVSRIIKTERSSALLVGVGGSGKQSLTKLASFIGSYQIAQIVLTKGFGETQLRDFIREFYNWSGHLNQPSTFLLTDAEIRHEYFLEFINMILSTGEIPNLIAKDDRDVWLLNIKTQLQKQKGKSYDPNNEQLWEIFINRVRDDLHLVLCFSPMGEKFQQRAQNFPSLFNECSINWFLKWPEEALVSVAEKFISAFNELDTEPETKLELQNHMGAVHLLVDDICDQYLKRMRRSVFVTPKSYLSFIGFYKDLYLQKYQLLDTDEQNFTIGLAKIAEAQKSIAKMGEELAKQQLKLDKVVEQVNKSMEVIRKESAAANKTGAEVSKIATECEANAEFIGEQKAIANKELEAAKPALAKAIKAAKGITGKDVKEVTGLKDKMKHIGCFVIDMVSILLHKKLYPCRIPKQTFQATFLDENGKKVKKEINWLEHSYLMVDNKKTYIGGYAVANGLGQELSLLQQLQRLGIQDKDTINDESCDLLVPYERARDDGWFTKINAFNLVQALAAMHEWCFAMKDYHEKSVKVQPLVQRNLQMEGELKVAKAKLRQAQTELAAVNAKIKALQDSFQAEMKTKNELDEKARQTKKTMDQAQRLISSLSGERKRWALQKSTITERKKRLVGDVSLCCAFLSYCGAFNSEFRQILISQCFTGDLKKRGVPVTTGLDIVKFLVDDTVVGEWSLQGLPKDDLSIQNGIMVTRSTRYPLLIDPQEQGMNWIRNKYADSFDPKTNLTTLQNKRFVNSLKMSMENGDTLLIDGIQNEVDPVLDPVLEKQYVIRGKSKTLSVQEQDITLNDNFNMFLFTRIPNPKFSPELSAKTLIIDFTVTQTGLEQQLLGRVLSKEQKQLEINLKQLLQKCSDNKKALLKLDEKLLLKLTSSTGNLIEDTELVQVLNETKTSAKEVANLLSVAEQQTEEINTKREQYRPTAIRGSVLYFCIIEMILIKWMYNTSLQQFLDVFDYSIDIAEKGSTLERVQHIINSSTYEVYYNINRGLYEADKTTFLLLIVFKILITDKKLSNNDVSIYLKGGGDLDLKSEKQPPSYLEPAAWLNSIKLSRHKFGRETHCFFAELPDTLQRHDKEWQEWLNRNDPELAPVPCEFQEKLDNNKEIGSFMKLCLVRCLRTDRTKIASKVFIKSSLGQRFIDPVSYPINAIYPLTKKKEPVLYLVKEGGDPTQIIDDFSKKQKVPCIEIVSMGQGQERNARNAITKAMSEGGWALLQNCHLGLSYMAELVELLSSDAVEEFHDDGRIWLTVEQSNDFPLFLLQNSIKITNEPPKGIKAGLYKTFTSLITQEFLERVEHENWKTMIYVMAFLHSVVLERRKFGPLGWCIPYQFNYSDLEATLMYFEHDLNEIISKLTLSQAANTLNLKWFRLQYMVCEVQYGGRITDDLDKELFTVYGKEIYIRETILLSQPYSIIDKTLPGPKNQKEKKKLLYQTPNNIRECEIPHFLEHIKSLPDEDNPECFGLNQDADLAFQLKETGEMLDVLMEIRPKEGGGGEGKSVDEQVKDTVNDFLSKMPPIYDLKQVRDQVNKLGGPAKLLAKGKQAKGLDVPLNVFLLQEVTRMDGIINQVTTQLKEIVLSIDGQIIMTPALSKAIDNVFDSRVPYDWMYDTTGAEISWLYPGLGAWFTSLNRRNSQLSRWVSNVRPPDFWMTGFFNPQGFLTSMKQEVTRMQKNKGNRGGGYSSGGGGGDVLALDDVTLVSEVQDKYDVLKLNNPKQEGVYIRELFLEAARWTKGSLDEPEEKQMYAPFPLLYMSAEKKKKGQGDMEKPQKYNCPIYKYKKRTDLYLITRVWLNCDGNSGGSKHWKLRGVALLCTKEA